MHSKLLFFSSGASLLALRRWMAGRACRSKVRLDGKTVLITGANTGIGKETALDMAQRGENVYNCLLTLCKYCSIRVTIGLHYVYLN